MLHEAPAGFYIQPQPDAQKPTSTSAISNAMPCYSARPLYATRSPHARASCTRPSPSKPWRSGESSNARAGLAEWRTRRQRLPLARRLCRMLRSVSEKVGSGKWEVEGARISQYRAGNWRRRAAMSDGLTISAEGPRRLEEREKCKVCMWGEVMFACCLLSHAKRSAMHLHSKVCVNRLVVLISR